MKYQKMPSEFRQKVRRYLHFLMNHKRNFKMEEEEVLELLTDNLKMELIVHLNGKMLHESILFKKFDLMFLSEVTFLLKREVFSLDEHIFDEDDSGDALYYITRGEIILVHKKTFTFLTQLKAEEFIGEVEFFSCNPRAVTARANEFTETLTLCNSDFLDASQNFP